MKANADDQKIDAVIDQPHADDDLKQISLLKYNHFYQLEKEDMILKEWIPDEKYNFQLQRSRNLTYNYGRRSRPYSYFNTSIPE